MLGLSMPRSQLRHVERNDAGLTVSVIQVARSVTANTIESFPGLCSWNSCQKDMQCTVGHHPSVPRR
jgi:hypothetical protein